MFPPVFFIIGFTWFITVPVVSLTPLFSSAASIELRFTNDKLSGTRFWFLFIYFIVSTIFRRFALALGISKPTKFTPDQDGTSCRISGKQPALSMPFRITFDDILTYNRAASIHSSGEASTSTSTSHNRPELPSDASHLQLFLSALTEPAMLLLLAKRGCPIDPIGSVNVRNRFELPNTPITCLEALRKALSNELGEERLIIHSELDQSVKKVKRGWEFSILVELRKGETVLYRQIFTSLQFAKHSNPPSTTSESTPLGISEKGESTVIQLSGNEPSVWAQLSKDYNPIHISAIAARLFGFKRKIAHGNHVVAKAIEAVSRQTSRSDGGNEWVEVEFRRPTFVPGRLEVRVGEGGLDIGEKGKTNTTVRYAR